MWTSKEEYTKAKAEIALNLKELNVISKIRFWFDSF